MKKYVFLVCIVFNCNQTINAAGIGGGVEKTNALTEAFLGVTGLGIEVSKLVLHGGKQVVGSGAHKLGEGLGFIAENVRQGAAGDSPVQGLGVSLVQGIGQGLEGLASSDGKQAPVLARLGGSLAQGFGTVGNAQLETGLSVLNTGLLNIISGTSERARAVLVVGDQKQQSLLQEVGGGLQDVLRGTTTTLNQGIDRTGQTIQSAISNVVGGANASLRVVLRGDEKSNSVFEDAANGVSGFLDGTTKNLNQNIENLTATTVERVKAITERDLPTISSNGIKAVFNRDNAIRVALPIALASAVVLSTYYGTSLAWKKLEASLAYKPAIILPGSNISMMDRFNRWRSGYKTPEMIMSDDQKKRLEEIIAQAKMPGTRGNLLLTGEPGTGKSLFAQYLADKAGLDFMATTAGALFQQDKAIQHIDEIFARAKKSKNGCVVFIDEADALFVNRDSLDVGSQHYQALNHWLALTGQGNHKFMIVAATNHAQVMDKAMARRFQDHVEMTLPDEKTRKSLVQLYAKTHLFGVKKNGKRFALEAQKVLTPEIIDQIVRDTHNLSHAEINDIVEAMRKKALSAKVEVAKGTRKKPERLLKVEHITSAVAQGVKKRQFFDVDRKGSPLPAA